MENVTSVRGGYKAEEILGLQALALAEVIALTIHLLQFRATRRADHDVLE